MLLRKGRIFNLFSELNQFNYLFVSFPCVSIETPKTYREPPKERQLPFPVEKDCYTNFKDFCSRLTLKSLESWTIDVKSDSDTFKAFPWICTSWDYDLCWRFLDVPNHPHDVGNKKIHVVLRSLVLKQKKVAFFQHLLAKTENLSQSPPWCREHENTLVRKIRPIKKF